MQSVILGTVPVRTQVHCCETWFTSVLPDAVMIPGTSVIQPLIGSFIF